MKLNICGNVFGSSVYLPRFLRRSSRLYFHFVIAPAIAVYMSPFFVCLFSVRPNVNSDDSWPQIPCALSYLFFARSSSRFGHTPVDLFSSPVILHAFPVHPRLSSTPSASPTLARSSKKCYGRRGSPGLQFGRRNSKISTDLVVTSWAAPHHRFPRARRRWPLPRLPLLGTPTTDER